MCFCFIIEEKYRNESMPIVIADQLLQWGHSPAELATLEIAEANESFFLAQRYIENAGFDVKLYVTGTEVYAVAKRSPLHPEVEVDKQLMPITLGLRKLALDVGKVFGLDIYGLDVV